MKMIIKVFLVILLPAIVFSCATTSGSLPEKYNLDNELEAIDKIYTFSVSSWEQVDIQSVILRTNLNDYYLLVLRRPMDTMITTLSIGISSSFSSITAGFDKIYVSDYAGRQHYAIEKIYKLEGKEQAKKIKERLRNN